MHTAHIQLPHIIALTRRKRRLMCKQVALLVLAHNLHQEAGCPQRGTLYPGVLLHFLKERVGLVFFFNGTLSLTVIAVF